MKKQLLTRENLTTPSDPIIDQLARDNAMLKQG